MQRILTSVVVLGLTAGTWTSSVSAQERDNSNTNRHRENITTDRNYHEDTSRESQRPGSADRESEYDRRSQEHEQRSSEYDRRNSDYDRRADHERRSSYHEGRSFNPFYGEWNRENIQVSKLPDSVQKTIRQQGREASVVRVDQETHRGKVQYRVQLRERGQRRYVTVAANGNLLSTAPSGPDFAGEEFTDYQRTREGNRDQDRRRFEEQRFNHDPAMDRSHERRGDPRANYRPGYEDNYSADRYAPYRFEGPDRYQADRYQAERYQPRGRMDYRDDRPYPAWQDRRFENPPPNRPADRQWSREREYDRGYDNYNPAYDRGYEQERHRGQVRDRSWEARDGSWERDEQRNESRRYDRDDEMRPIRMSDLPANVRQTINKHAGENSVDRIERETYRGQIGYRVHLRDEGKSSFFRVAPDGSYIGAEPDGDATQTKGERSAPTDPATKETPSSTRPGQNRTTDSKEQSKPDSTPDK